MTLEFTTFKLILSSPKCIALLGHEFVELPLNCQYSTMVTLSYFIAIVDVLFVIYSSLEKHFKEHIFSVFFTLEVHFLAI